MGSGASASEAIQKASNEELVAAVASLGAEGRQRLRAALPSKAFDGLEFQNKGEWEEACKAHYDEEMKGFEGFTPEPNADFYGMMRQALDFFTPQDDAHKKFDDMVEIEKIEEMGGPDFHPDAAKNYCLVHRVKGKPTTGRKCLVYFHGGGVCAGTPEQHQSCTNRVAVECDCTVVNVNYRLCPETPIPGPVYDCYADLKWVLANAEKLGIDKDRVGMFGESGGGHLVAAVSVLLADKNEGALIKFQMPQLAMVDDMYFKDDWSSYTPVEQAQGTVTKTFQTLWLGEGKSADDFKARVSDPLVCPVSASDDQFKKMPKCIALTTEFDALRKPTSAFFKKCEANGTGLELGILSGCHHGHYVHYNFKAADLWFAAHARVVQLYL